ncbi:MAG: NAD(P)H-dependent oxidoreductase [Candidatus Marinimicrobia bacterium]|nr:NAD(P)H-dependent oxidoreductase [Candidatus Neomarinimicrobiota bacterium]
MNILHVCANPKPTEESVSKQLAVQFFSALVAKNAEVEIQNLDLYQTPPPFLSYDAFRGAWNPVFVEGYRATEKEVAALNYAEKQGELFNAADVLVVTTPMWNFSLPAILKAWLDQILTPGVTFSLERDGPRPLHHIRKAVLLVAPGGTYKEDDPRDALTMQFRAAVGFIGISEVDIAWADGQNPLFFADSAQRKQLAVEAAQEIAEEVAEMD